MGNGKSQETLDSVGLQTYSEKGAEEQEEMTGEGKNNSGPKLLLLLAQLGKRLNYSYE